MVVVDTLVVVVLVVVVALAVVVVAAVVVGDVVAMVVVAVAGVVAVAAVVEGAVLVGVAVVAGAEEFDTVVVVAVVAFVVVEAGGFDVVESSDDGLVDSDGSPTARSLGREPAAPSIDEVVESAVASSGPLVDPQAAVIMATTAISVRSLCNKLLKSAPRMPI